MQKSSLELFFLYLILVLLKWVGSKNENFNNIEDVLSLDDILSILKELEYMEKHPEKYPTYDNIEDLKKALLSDDE